MNTSSTTKPGDAQAASVISPAAKLADTVRKFAATHNIAVEAVLEELGAIHAAAPKATKSPMLYIQAHPKTLTFLDPDADGTGTIGDAFYFVHKLAQTIPYGTVFTNSAGKLVRAVPAKLNLPVRLEPYTPSDYKALAAAHIYAFRPIPKKHLKGEPVTDEDGKPVPVRPYVSDLEEKYGERLDLSPKWLEDELNQPAFLDALPTVKQLMPYPCCVPVRNGGHLVDIRRIGEGYDRDSQLFVVSAKTPEVPQMTLEQAREFVWDYLQDFPFDGVLGDPMQPSAGAAVTAMIGALCHDCFDYWPIAVASANAPGSGKSLLLAVIFSPFFGSVSDSSVSVNFTADMDRAAQVGFPLAWFDEMPSVTARAIFDYSTKTTANFRMLGMTGGREIPWRTQLAISGNMINYKEDLERRALELNIQFMGKDRHYAHQFIKQEILSEEWRAKMREAVYTIAREFIDSGAFADKTKYVLTSHRDGFEEYFDFCARAAMFAGFGDATARRNLATIGDNDSSVLRSIFDAAAHYIACLPEATKSELDVHHLFGNLNFDSTRGIGKEVRFSTIKLKQTLEYNGLLDCFGSDKVGLMQRLGAKLGKFHGGVQGKFNPTTYTTELGVSYQLGYSRNYEGSGMLIKVIFSPKA